MSDDALAGRLLVIFTDELNEQVRQLNDDLLALERTPDDAERLRAVFRVMHTLKGASRAAGLPLIEEACHALENELSNVRDGRATLGDAQIALLFEAADALGETHASLQAGQPIPEVRLTNLLRLARGRGIPASLDKPAARSSRPNIVVDEPPPSAAVIVATPMTRAPETAREENSTTQQAEGADQDMNPAAHVRVTLMQVDAIAGAAGELAGLVAVLGERADELSAMRARRRTQRGRGSGDDGLDQELTRLLRKAGEDARALAAVSGRLGASARHLRQRPFSELTETLPRVARDVAREVGKQVRVVVVGADIEADRVVLETLREPLLHLVRNAVDHGIESPEERVALGKIPEGEIRIEGSLRGDRLVVVISDDGQGLDLDAVRRGLVRRGRDVPVDPAELAQTIFDEGFSTRTTATTISGRGVGLGIVRSAVERMGGMVHVSSSPQHGTSITMDVPVSIATMRVILVDVGGVVVGIPSAFVVRVARADPRKLVRVDGRAMLATKNKPIPVLVLAALLGPPFRYATGAAMLQLVILESGGEHVALIVDDLLDERELVLRPLENAGTAAANVTVGTALLGTGVVTIVVNVPVLLAQNGGSGSSAGAFTEEREELRAPARVLVVDDSITSRTLERSVLSAAGYNVITAVDGAEAWRIIERQDIALVVSDVEMPNLDGFGLCERIRGHARTASLPVILVTSLDEPAQRARGLEAGADAYITKSSFDQDTLLDTVRMLLGSEAGATK